MHWMIDWLEREPPPQIVYGVCLVFISSWYLHFKKKVKSNSNLGDAHLASQQQIN